MAWVCHAETLLFCGTPAKAEVKTPHNGMGVPCDDPAFFVEHQRGQGMFIISKYPEINKFKQHSIFQTIQVFVLETQ